MDREECQQVRAEITPFLEEIAKKHGCILNGFGMSYGPTGLSARIKMEKPSSLGTGSAESEKNFKILAHRYGLQPENFGQEFDSQGEIYIITGLKTRRKKFPISAIRKRDKRGFKFPANMVLRGLVSLQKREARTPVNNGKTKLMI